MRNADVLDQHTKKKWWIISVPRTVTIDRSLAILQLNYSRFPRSTFTFSCLLASGILIVSFQLNIKIKQTSFSFSAYFTRLFIL